MAYAPACGEKEYYLGSACDELYAPPSAYFSLYGLTVQASFLGGKLVLARVTLFHINCSQQLCWDHNKMLFLRNDCVQMMGSRNGLFFIAYKIDMQILLILTIVSVRDVLK